MAFEVNRRLSAIKRIKDAANKERAFIRADGIIFLLKKTRFKKRTDNLVLDKRGF